MSLRTGAPPNYARRRIIDRIMRALTVVATATAVVPLVLILGYVLVVGGSGLSVSFFTETYQAPLMGDFTDPTLVDPAVGAPEGGANPDDPYADLDLGALTGATPAEPTDGHGSIDLSQVSSGGGVLHGIVGTLLVTLVGLLLALPVGLLAGVFLAEYDNNWLATATRFCTDVLSGAPSIVIGVVAYILIVQQTRTFSGLAGSIAIALLMVPTITRTTEEILRLVPQTVREAAMGLGAPTWYTTFTVVIPTALTGIVTGVLLAFARGAGETAPLILTVLGNNTLSVNMLAPIAALPLLAYRYTESPFPTEIQLAWSTSFVLVVLVLFINIALRLATRSRLRGR
ncbi:MAG: phosphate ABC transporter permease PstA [Chloroflexi bacterium]|nr:phosphate ABC transporter permease PstA [Chloroflexota bacterium]